MKLGDIVFIDKCLTREECNCVGIVGILENIDKTHVVVRYYGEEGQSYVVGSILENIRLATSEEERVFYLLRNLGK